MFLLPTLAVLLFLFLPGYLIVRMDKNPHNSLWQQVMYSHGISLVFVTLLGLAINFILPLQGINDPLSSNYLKIIFSVVLILLAIISLLVKKPSLKQFDTSHYTFNFLTSVILLITPIPSIVAIIGTLVLNNGYSNTTSLIGLAAISVQFLAALPLSNFFKDKTSYLIFTLLCISAGIIFMTSMRGEHVTGSDILLEYRMASITQSKNKWIQNIPSHAYNACLSITLLPTILSNLSNSSLLSIFKIFLQIPIILSVLPVFFISKKFLNYKYAYAASVAFISFPAFSGIMPMHLRQAVAIFCFFLITQLVIENGKSYLKRSYIYWLAIGMVISHYSTTYIGSGLFLLYFFACLFAWLFLKFRFFQKLRDKYFTEVAFFRFINPLFLIFLFGCMYIWYFQVTNLSKGLINFTHKVSSGLHSENSLAVREESSFTNQFNIFFKRTQTNGVNEDYNSQVLAKYERSKVDRGAFFQFTPEELEGFKIKTLTESLIPPKFDIKTVNRLLVAADIFKKSYKILTVLGVFAIFGSIFFMKKKNFELNYFLFLLIAFSILFAFTALPFFSIDYDVFRTYHQLLIVLALPSVFGLTSLLWIIKVPGRVMLSVVFFAIYFTLSTRLFYDFTGAYPHSLILHNTGDDYNRYYITKSDVVAVKWMERIEPSFIPVHADTYAIQKIRSLTTRDLPFNDELNQLAITQFGYVFLSSQNTSQGVAYKSNNNRLIKYAIPLDFIDDHKSKLYTNRKTEIYK